MKKIVLAAGLLLAGSFVVQAQTHADIIHAASADYEKADKELNAAYRTLYSKLGPKGKTALQNSQRIWLQHRDAEFQVIDLMYQQIKMGGMGSEMRISDRTGIIADRAKQLSNMVKMYEL